jgi:hypothetical protein
MTDWTEETWSFDGTTLNNYAYGVMSVGEGLPDRRGSNRTISYRHGDQWRRKWFEPRIISLSMFIQDHTTGDALPATDQLRREQFNDNLDALRQLFGKTRNQSDLVRTVRTSSGLETRTAQAEPTALREFIRHPDLRLARFVVDFHLSDPFFYGGSATQQSISAKDTPTTVTNDGTAEATDWTIVITGGTGGAVNPVLTNTDLAVSFTYTGTIAVSDTVTFDTGAGTATHSGSGDVTTSVTHSGDRSWMVLNPGNNTLELTMTSGAGSVTFDYNPPFL